MLILDTDCLSIFQRERHFDTSILRANLSHFDSEDIAVTIITYEEQMRGWMAFIAKAKTVEQQVYAYQKLNGFLENFRKINVLPFDETAAKIYKDLKSQKIRIGSMDLKIASIAISRKAILVSRNLKDFEAVPDLVVNDWTR
ncbi:MAG TPA: type II toxin-antitoxin system VapC family toxin [Pyrinomonadaceae bacterium]|nr:type II toxin-antitoxin system VapC family toxin [Pyrinomonadaceae bacterium]